MNAPSRFDDLLRLWRDGEASVEELAELETFLRSDARYRRSLARSLQLEVALYARYAVGEGARIGAAPLRRRRLNALAAALAIGISVLAAGAFLLRVPGVRLPGRVESGELRVNGELARLFDLGDSLEAPAGARLRLKEGPELVLEPGSAGAFLDPARFELRRGGASFAAASPLRVLTPLASLSGAGAFSAKLDLPGLRLAVENGRVDVDYDGLRHGLEAGERVLYLPPVERKASHARDAERRAGEAVLDLAAAVERALKRVPGVAVNASLEREDGRLEISVRVVRDRKTRELVFDAQSGALLEDEAEEKDRAALAAAKVPLRDAVAAARAKAPGVALEADVELVDGRLLAEVEILSNGRLYEVRVDLERGAVLSVGPDTP